MNISNQWKFFVYFLAFFLAGVLCGGIGGFRISHARFMRPPASKDMVAHAMDRYKSRLSLTETQINQIQPIVVATVQRISEMHMTLFSNVVAEMKGENKLIRDFLSPEQQKLLDAMEQEREKGPMQGKRPHGDKGPHPDDRKPHDMGPPPHGEPPPQ